MPTTTSLSQAPPCGAIPLCPPLIQLISEKNWIMYWGILEDYWQRGVKSSVVPLFAVDTNIFLREQ